MLCNHGWEKQQTQRPKGSGPKGSGRQRVCDLFKAPYSQFGEEARPRLCMDEWNRPTSVRRRLSLTQAVQGKLIPTGLALVLGIKTTRSLKVFSQYSAFHLWFVHSEARMPSLARCLKDSVQLAQMGVWILVSLGKHLKSYLKDHIRYDQSPEIHGGPKRVSLKVGVAQLAGWLESIGKWFVELGRRHPVTMHKASFKTLSMRRVRLRQHCDCDTVTDLKS